MFKKILVPVDGSDNSRRAVIAAASLAEKYSSQVTLMYVMALPTRNPAYVPDLGMIPQSVLDDMKLDGQKILDRAVAEFNNSAVVNSIMRSGNPQEEIVGEAADNYDLVVLGSRGLGEIKGFVLGSVSSQVSHQVQCTIMIVH